MKHLTYFSKMKRPTAIEALYLEVSPTNPGIRSGMDEAPRNGFRQKRSRDIGHRVSHRRQGQTKQVKLLRHNGLCHENKKKDLH